MKVLVIGGDSDGVWWDSGSNNILPEKVCLISPRHYVVTPLELGRHTAEHLADHYRLEVFTSYIGGRNIEKFQFYVHEGIHRGDVFQMLVDGYRKGGANG